MRAAWYEKQGPAREVLTVGEMPDPIAAAGEVRIRIAASGVNPGDIKKREDMFGYGMAYPRVIPHSDGAGRIDQVGKGVSAEWVGRSVWCHGAQSYRPFGTAAEFELAFAYVQRLYFVFEGGSRDVETGSGSRRPRDPAAAFGQCRFDDLAFTPGVTLNGSRWS